MALAVSGWERKMEKGDLDRCKYHAEYLCITNKKAIFAVNYSYSLPFH
jgi:hypothetical protein